VLGNRRIYQTCIGLEQDLRTTHYAHRTSPCPNQLLQRFAHLVREANNMFLHAQRHNTCDDSWEGVLDQNCILSKNRLVESLRGSW